jgi:hypothetical protein
MNMKDCKESELANIVIERVNWGCFYKGSKEALIAAGLATAEQFPGMPGRGSTSVTLYKGQPYEQALVKAQDEHYKQIQKCGKNLFQIKVCDSRDLAWAKNRVRYLCSDWVSQVRKHRLNAQCAGKSTWVMACHCAPIAKFRVRKR